MVELFLFVLLNFTLMTAIKVNKANSCTIYGKIEGVKSPLQLNLYSDIENVTFENILAYKDTNFAVVLENTTCNIFDRNKKIDIRLQSLGYDHEDIVLEASTYISGEFG